MLDPNCFVFVPEGIPGSGQWGWRGRRSQTPESWRRPCTLNQNIIIFIQIFPREISRKSIFNILEVIYKMTSQKFGTLPRPSVTLKWAFWHCVTNAYEFKKDTLIKFETRHNISWKIFLKQWCIQTQPIIKTCQQSMS